MLSLILYKVSNLQVKIFSFQRQKKGCHYSQTGCSFDGNSAMLWRNVPILMGSLLDTTCNIQFKFARASCQVPVFDIPVLKVIIPPLFQRSGK